MRLRTSGWLLIVDSAPPALLPLSGADLVTPPGDCWPLDGAAAQQQLASLQVAQELPPPAKVRTLPLGVAARAPPADARWRPPHKRTGAA